MLAKGVREVSDSFYPAMTPLNQVEVNGVVTDNGPWCWGPQRFAAGYFTADEHAVQALLPSEELHPVAVRRGRALVMAYGFDCSGLWGTWCPPFRYGEVGVLALVTHGAEAAPPGVGAVLPNVSQRAAQKRGFGMYLLQLAVTNRLARDLGNVFLGTNKFLADVRNEQRRTTDRFVATEDGTHVFDLTVRSDGRPRQTEQSWRLYADAQGVLWARENHANGVVRTRIGTAAATMTLGSHPATQHLRSLGLSSRGSVALFSTDYKTFTGDAYPIGPATRQIPDYGGSDAAQASLVVSPAPGIEYEAEQFPCEMPFGLTPDLEPGPDLWARANQALAVARA
jgi:hypothetical protein